MSNIFREVRDRVSARDAAQFYGITFDRKGWALCPFHADKHPSMSFRDGRFRCWSCGAAGDSVDFVERLLGLDAMGAVDRLNADFALALPIHRKPTKAETANARQRMEIDEAYKAFEEWRKQFINLLAGAYREGHLIMQQCSSIHDLTEREAEAIRWHADFEYWLEMLESGKIDEKMQVFRERKGIALRVEKILNHTPTKSGAA